MIMPAIRAAERVLPDVSRSLAGIDLLQSLDPQQLHALERRCLWRKWRPGEQIIDRETMADDVYFVVRGRARVVDYSSSGSREVVFDELGEGACFGELAAIDGEPRSANIVAVVETLTASLAGDEFITLLFENREIGLTLMRRLSEMVRTSTGRIMDLSTLGAHNRIYAELLRLARTCGAGRPNQAVISPIPVHSDIAARVSTTRETVARVLSELTHRDLLRRDGDALCILDLGQLTNMVHKFKE
jgi:CRP/FNR family transcriptional regulator, cyclic AMP receptor protein